MISASTAIPPVVEAIRQGAVDFVGKPFDAENIRHLVSRALETKRLHRQVAILENEVSDAFRHRRLWAGVPRLSAVIEQLRQAAATDATVLIQGESGTGKELAARLLHAQSPRRGEPFVAVHCAALPESLLESELFGTREGRVHQCRSSASWAFELAGAGTLFFDEIGEMTVATQVKLLRVLQEREFMRVGGTRLLRTNARIVAATARGPAQDGRRRVVPRRPLLSAERRAGPFACAARTARRHSAVVGPFSGPSWTGLRAAARGFEPEAMRCLCDYAWPGNVRELRNVVERVLVLHGQSPVITVAQLPEEFHCEAGQGQRASEPSPQPVVEEATAPSVSSGTLEEAVNAYERHLILAALHRTGAYRRARPRRSAPRGAFSATRWANWD
jgi:DNA-binding NtrC family response regulator